MALDKGPEGYSCEACSAAVLDTDKEAWMEYRDCDGLEAGCQIEVLLSATKQGSVEVCVDDVMIASWNGVTEGFETVTFVCEKLSEKAAGTVMLRISGDARVAGFTIK